MKAISQLQDTRFLTSADVSGSNLEGVWASTNPTPTSAEYDVELTLKSLYTGADDGPLWLLARVDGAASDAYAVRILRNAASTNLFLYKRDAGGLTTLDSTDFDLNVNDVLKLEIRDAAKKFYVNDVERLSSTDNAVTAAGKAGWGVGRIYVAGDDVRAIWTIDDFVVTQF